MKYGHPGRLQLYLLTAFFQLLPKDYSKLFIMKSERGFVSLLLYLPLINPLKDAELIIQTIIQRDKQITMRLLSFFNYFQISALGMESPSNYYMAFDFLFLVTPNEGKCLLNTNTMIKCCHHVRIIDTPLCCQFEGA